MRFLQKKVLKKGTNKIFSFSFKLRAKQIVQLVLQTIGDIHCSKAVDVTLLEVSTKKWCLCFYMRKKFYNKAGFDCNPKTPKAL